MILEKKKSNLNFDFLTNDNKLFFEKNLKCPSCCTSLSVLPKREYILNAQKLELGVDKYNDPSFFKTLCASFKKKLVSSKCSMTSEQNKTSKVLSLNLIPSSIFIRCALKPFNLSFFIASFEKSIHVKSCPLFFNIEAFNPVPEPISKILSFFSFGIKFLR